MSDDTGGTDVAEDIVDVDCEDGDPAPEPGTDLEPYGGTDVEVAQPRVTVTVVDDEDGDDTAPDSDLPGLDGDGRSTPTTSDSATAVKGGGKQPGSGGGKGRRPRRNRPPMGGSFGTGTRGGGFTLFNLGATFHLPFANAGNGNSLIKAGNVGSPTFGGRRPPAGRRR